METDIADSIAMSGEDHDVSITEIREEAGFKDNPYITDDLIYQKRAEAEAEVQSMVDLPDPIPDLVKQIIRDLAVGRLWVKNYNNISLDQSMGYQRLKETRKILDDLVKKYKVTGVTSKNVFGSLGYQTCEEYDDITDFSEEPKFSIHEEF